MQKYYLRKESSYFKYFNQIHPGCLDYILDRCEKTVIPNIQKLINLFTSSGNHIIYLKISSSDAGREDLHRLFRETYIKAKEIGFDNVYPMTDDPMADIINELKPSRDDIIINKTGFSPFSSTDIDSLLKKLGISTLVFTGLATSQCVETTARDASDHNYTTILIEDALADYGADIHNISLYNSQGVCGGLFFLTDEFIETCNKSNPPEGG